MIIDRNLNEARRTDFDLIIVGGGIYGISLALESVARGLRPLLIEKDDFGGATSGQTLRIIHGGFRYLQSFDLKRFRRSVEQRRWWLSTFPELVQPVRCVLPLHGNGLLRPSVLRAALLTNDLLSLDRNRDVREDRRIPRARVLGPSETVDLFPSCRRDGLLGSALWYDASMPSPHRLMIEMLRWIVASGGTALNYVAARRLQRHGAQVSGVVASDELTGQELAFSAPVVVNAAGPWCREVSRRFDQDRIDLFRPSLAFNVLLRTGLRASVAVAVSPPRPGARTFFLRPCGDLTFAGTHHASGSGQDPDAVAPTEEQVSDFLANLRSAVPDFSPRRDDVQRVFAGLLPAARENGATTARRPRIVDHAADGGPSGLVSVSGVKFTTAPAVARSVLNEIYGGRRAADWERLRRQRPELRQPPSLSEVRERLETEGEDDRLRAALKTLSEEEGARFAEDLVERRLDWRLEDAGREEGLRIVTELLPNLPARDDR